MTTKATRCLNTKIGYTPQDCFEYSNREGLASDGGLLLLLKRFPFTFQLEE